MVNKEISTKILIADSSSLFRVKLTQIIADHLILALTTGVGSENELMSELSRNTFDILIIDSDLSDGNGLNMLKKVKTIAPDMPVLVMSMFPLEQYEESIYRAGAHGYIAKINLASELIDALNQILQGKRFFSTSTRRSFGKEVGNEIKDLEK